MRGKIKYKIICIPKTQISVTFEINKLQLQPQLYFVMTVFVEFAVPTQCAFPSRNKANGVMKSPETLLLRLSVA